MVLMLLLASLPVHSRLVTQAGPVHVSIPPTATLTVVYVHGFWTNVDDAWVQHRLLQQLGGVDAAIIAPEAPSGPGERVRWASLSALLTEVEARTGAKLPGTVIAIGHSGAYRTLQGWIGDERLRGVVLLDAFYGSERPWQQLLARGGELRIVARSTASRSAPFCERNPQAACERSPLGHMQIVTSGEIIPRVLREAAARVIPHA